MKESRTPEGKTENLPYHPECSIMCKYAQCRRPLKVFCRQCDRVMVRLETFCPEHHPTNWNNFCRICQLTERL